MAPPPGLSRDRVYRFVRDRLVAGQPPTLREVQAALGFRAVESARAHLDALVSGGLLTKEAGRARGYRLPGGGAPTLVPIVGRVDAGPLTTAVEDLEGFIPVHVRGSAELFALRVRGESMTGAGILPGDVVVVRRQSAAKGGEIVVALVGDEATVKRLRLRPGLIELCPENPAFTPIRVAPGELQILGKVIEVRRFLESPVLQAAARGG